MGAWDILKELGQRFGTGDGIVTFASMHEVVTKPGVDHLVTAGFKCRQLDILCESTGNVHHGAHERCGGEAVLPQALGQRGDGVAEPEES